MRICQVLIMVAPWILVCSLAFSDEEYDELMKAARENAQRYIYECDGRRGQEITQNDKLIQKAMEDYNNIRNSLNASQESKVPNAVKWLAANGNLSLPYYAIGIIRNVEEFLAATSTESGLWDFTDKVLKAEPNRRTAYTQEEFNSKLKQISNDRDSMQNKIDSAIASSDDQIRQDMDDLLNKIDSIKENTCNIYESVIGCMESRRDNETSAYQTLQAKITGKADYNGINYHKTVADTLGQVIESVRGEMMNHPNCSGDRTQGQDGVNGLQVELKRLRREQAFQYQINQMQTQRVQKLDRDYGERLTRQAQAEYGPDMKEAQDMLEKVKSMPGSDEGDNHPQSSSSREKQRGSEAGQNSGQTHKSELESAMGY